MVKIIKPVLENSSSGQLSIVLPKGCGLKKGDYVVIFSLPSPELQELWSKKD